MQRRNRQTFILQWGLSNKQHYERNCYAWKETGDFLKHLFLRGENFDNDNMNLQIYDGLRPSASNYTKYSNLTKLHIFYGLRRTCKQRRTTLNLCYFLLTEYNIVEVNIKPGGPCINENLDINALSIAFCCWLLFLGRGLKCLSSVLPSIYKSLSITVAMLMYFLSVTKSTQL